MTGEVNEPVLEDDEGNFVHYRDPETDAVPFWEAGTVLKPTSAPTQKWKERKIYTIVDNGGPDGKPDNRLDKYDTPVEFSEDNAEALREYLGIGSSASECPQIAASLGRPLAGGTRTATVPLVAPQTLFEPRITRLDLRVSKIVQINRVRLQLNLDAYNALNAGSIISVNDTFNARWRQPDSIIDPRHVQIGGQISF